MTSYSLNTVQITALKSERKILKKNGVNTCNVWFEKISISPPPHGRDRIFQGEGGVNLPNFPVGSGGGGGGHHREIFPEGSRDA